MTDNIIIAILVNTILLCCPQEITDLEAVEE